MIVTINGDLTQDQRFERGLQLFVEKWAPVVLAGTRVKEVKLCFKKDKFKWRNGFQYLTYYDVVHLPIPKGYRSHWMARWVVIHDMCHALQQLEKRLGKSTRRVYYRRPRGQGHVYVRQGKGLFKVNGKTVGPVWEYEVNRELMPRFLGKRFHRQLSDKACR